MKIFLFLKNIYARKKIIVERDVDRMRNIMLEKKYFFLNSLRCVIMTLSKMFIHSCNRGTPFALAAPFASPASALFFSSVFAESPPEALARRVAPSFFDSFGTSPPTDNLGQTMVQTNHFKNYLRKRN